MATLMLAPFELERRRLRATKAQLDQRWAKVGQTLTTSLERSAHKITIDADYQAGGVWTGLRGVDVERIDRNRGTASVAPFIPLANNLSAWLGYQEVWDLENGRVPFAFRQASFTIHVGEVGDPLKPQLLRLEWPGLRDWDHSGVGFQSSGAGHPHWQIDLFESFRNARDSVTFDPELEDQVESFDDVIAVPTLLDRIHELTFEKMHLASAAPWWLSRPAEFGLHHLNAPSDAQELSRWMTAAIDYIRQELSRCVRRR